MTKSRWEGARSFLGIVAGLMRGTTPSLVAGIAIAFSGAATYWDIASHFEGERERFLTPPHIGIYSGVTVALLAIALGLLIDRLDRGATVRHALLHPFRESRPGLAAAGTGMATALAAAPLDNMWHEIYGIDITIWSPPHLLAIFGVSAASLGLAMLVAPATRSYRPILFHFLLSSLLTGLVITTGEFEFNGPQYRIAYHPMVLAAAAALVLAAASRGPHRWAATRVALIFEGLRLASVVFLAARGYPLPFVPLLLPTALIADLLRAAVARHPLLLGAGLGAVTVATNALVAELLGGIAWRGDDLVLGALGAVLASAVATSIGVGLGRGLNGREPTFRVASSATFGVAVFLSLVFTVPSAFAHDVGGDAGAGVISWEPGTFGPRQRVELRITDLRVTSGETPNDVTAEFWRAQHRLVVPLRQEERGYLGTFELPDEGPWMLLIRVQAGDRSLLATRQVDVERAREPVNNPHAERFTLGLDKLAGSDPPQWLDLIAYGVSLGILGLLLAGLFRSLRRLAAEGAADA